ncbi:MAG: metFprotein [Alphaproteobacteria bacterium]
MSADAMAGLHPVQAFLTDASIEVTPREAEKIDSFRDLLAPDTRVFVTFLPGSDFADTIRTAERLRRDGMRPVPHIAARSVPDAASLDRWLRDLAEEAAPVEALVIGGGLDQPVGGFDASIEVLRTGLLEKHGIRRIGVAGHPEGSPDISDAAIAEAIAQKNAYAEQSGTALYIATQFVFAADPVIAWDKRLRVEGNRLPIEIGLPGLATLKSLLRHAKACGVGNSMRVITRQAANLSRLLLPWEPDALVAGLARYQANDRECGIRAAHFFALGAPKRTVGWLRAVQDGAFEMKRNDSGFKLTRPLDQS